MWTISHHKRRFTNKVHISIHSAIRACAILLAVSFAFLPSEALAREGIHRDYQLEKVVIFSRHNLRAPMGSDKKKIDAMTPHTWFTSDTKAGELSKRGGLLETMMGQYFREYLEKEQFMKPHEAPVHGNYRFFADSSERTVATAHYFSAGLLPDASVSIKYRKPLGPVDPLFGTKIPSSLNEEEMEALRREAESHGHRILEENKGNLSTDYSELEQVLDVKDSKAWKEGSFTGFREGDTELTYETGKKPKMAGSLKLAHSLSDFLLIQYYETEDDRKAAFGHEMSKKDWEKIGNLKDLYGQILYSSPSLAKAIGTPLLHFISSEMESTRKLTYICGHDSNISILMAALDISPYELPESLEKKVPFGMKIVIEKWKSGSHEYGTVTLVYPSTDEIRRLSPMGLSHPPMTIPLHFQGIPENEDGMVDWGKLVERFKINGQRSAD